MITYLKDCIHEFNDLVIKNIDSVYFKELEVIITADLSKAKRGEKPITEIRQIINTEKIHVHTLLGMIAMEIKGISRGYEEPPKYPVYEYITENMLETLPGTPEQLLSKLKLHEIREESTPEEIKEIAPVYIHILKERLLEEYLAFLDTVTNKIESIANDPEYWRMRSEDNPREHILLDTSEKAQQDIDHTLGVLVTDMLIKRVKNQYWMTEFASVQKIITKLETKLKLNLITVPEKNSIEQFIKAHIRDKKGKDIKGAVNSAKYRTKKSVK